MKKRTTYADQRQIMRHVSVRADTINEDQRSVEVIVATENPVERFDFNRGETINEVLMMDGVEFRTSKRQLPIVDSHDRSTVKNVLGSVRNLRAEGDELIGDAVFASDEESQTAFTKLREGHLTDFSITASPNEIKYIPRGESATVRNQTIDGPAEIVSRWRPSDASLVAAGADERSTVRDLRRSYELPELQRRHEAMSTALLESLHGLGMPEDLNDEQAQEWLKNNVNQVEPEGEPEGEPESEGDPEPTEEPASVLVDRALKADRSRQQEIRALCTSSGIERADADKLCDDGVSLDAARKVVLDTVIERGKALGQSVEVTGSQIDKTHDAIRDGLIQRSITATGCKRTPAFDENNKPAAGHTDFVNMSLMRMAEISLESGGIDTRRLSSRDIAMVALGHKSTIKRAGIQRDSTAYHTTGSFANLLQDAANKTLTAGYEEAPYTWMAWARQAGSVQDFKSIKRNRFSEAPDMEVVPENTAYPEGKMTDEKETYSVEKYGQIFSVSWETIVNDDLDAISRVPAMHGNAARRKQNQKVYSVLTANAVMADTGALFNATAETTAGGHANLAGSGAVISVATLNAGFLSMMTRKGLNTSVTINVQPRFLIVPAAIAATALQVVGSIADPSNAAASTEDATRPNFNSNVLNIYGPNGTRPLQVVADPELDGNSATIWYLAADPGQIDTVELSFLAGEETPVLDTEWSFETDTYKYKIRQTFGVAAIDYRGLYQNPGA